MLTGLTTDHAAAREEFFSPVAVIFPATGEGDALRIANDTLTASAPTSSPRIPHRPRALPTASKPEWSSSTASAPRGPSSLSGASSVPDSVENWAERVSRSSSTRSSSAPSHRPRQGPHCFIPQMSVSPRAMAIAAIAGAHNRHALDAECCRSALICRIT
ncbi:aldehyde dehydrogenase family protein [Streptomyces sp. NBC_00250]|uniref:aldehyde dehydrogenase family protein n=1 Tax=Streptomyces sp. NBC_00250 TaxID=2903641 RepID=UPI003FA705EC